jgi:hypothetical protein
MNCIPNYQVQRINEVGYYQYINFEYVILYTASVNEIYTNRMYKYII